MLLSFPVFSQSVPCISYILERKLPVQLRFEPLPFMTHKELVFGFMSKDKKAKVKNEVLLGMVNMPVTLALGRLRQEDHEFEANWATK
jgi:hypothetical protein